MHGPRMRRETLSAAGTLDLEAYKKTVTSPLEPSDEELAETRVLNTAFEDAMSPCHLWSWGHPGASQGGSMRSPRTMLPSLTKLHRCWLTIATARQSYTHVLRSLRLITRIVC